MPNLLARHAEAASLFPEGLRAALDEHVMPVRARARATIVSLGTSSTTVYLVLEGRVQVAIFSMGGREMILRDLGPGALFGELSALDDQPRSASIIALDDCLLAAIPGPLFRRLVTADAEAALWMTRRLVAQVRDLTEKLFELNVLRVPSRLHCELLRLCGSDRDGQLATIDHFPTHAELAARIGAQREAVTRELRFLARSRIVEQQRGRKMLIDVPALSKLLRETAGDAGAHLTGEDGNGTVAVNAPTPRPLPG